MKRFSTYLLLFATLFCGVGYSQITTTPMRDYCRNEGRDTLRFASPTGGVYSGRGVWNDSLFYPSSAGAGTHWIKYTFGGVTDSVSVTVNESPRAILSAYSSLCNDISNRDPSCNGRWFYNLTNNRYDREIKVCAVSYTHLTLPTRS